MQNTSAINLNGRIRRTDRMAGVDPAQTMPDAKKIKLILLNQQKMKKYLPNHEYFHCARLLYHVMM